MFLPIRFVSSLDENVVAANHHVVFGSRGLFRQSEPFFSNNNHGGTSRAHHMAPKNTLSEMIRENFTTDTNITNICHIISYHMLKQEHRVMCDHLNSVHIVDGVCSANHHSAFGSRGHVPPIRVTSFQFQTWRIYWWIHWHQNNYV